MDSGHLKAGGPRPQTERRSARGRPRALPSLSLHSPAGHGGRRTAGPLGKAGRTQADRGAGRPPRPGLT